MEEFAFFRFVLLNHNMTDQMADISLWMAFGRMDPVFLKLASGTRSESNLSYKKIQSFLFFFNFSPSKFPSFLAMGKKFYLLENNIANFVTIFVCNNLIAKIFY